MNNVKLNISDLEAERRTIIMIYKKQLESYYQIKKQIENARWDDERYDRTIDSLNTIGRALLDGLEKLTNGNEVYAIDEVILASKKYLENKSRFPKA